MSAAEWSVILDDEEGDVRIWGWGFWTQIDAFRYAERRRDDDLNNVPSLAPAWFVSIKAIQSKR